MPTPLSPPPTARYITRSSLRELSLRSSNTIRSDDGDDTSSSLDNNIDTSTSRERDREVSSVGSSTSTRSELKQAKRERRQKLKEGEVAEAFTGNELGKSCEDEGMTEIVVPCQLMSSDAVEHHEWATPMLSSPQPVVVASATSSSTSKRANLRRGKRDLMKSWLATPLGCDDSLSSDSGVVPHNSLLPIRGVDETINTSLEPTSPFSPSQLVLYPPMQDEKLIAKIESSTEYVSQSQTIVCSQNSPPPPRPSISSKSIDRQSPEHSDLIILSSEVDRGNSNIVSNPPLSPLQDTLLSEEDSGAESSTSSVRHSRPRDTIRSIHALRFSPTTTPTVLSAIANDELPTVWHRQHQLPSLFEQMSPPWALTDGSDNPHGHHHTQDRDGNNHHRLSSSSRLSLHDVSCTLLGASHNNAPLQVSGLRLQPSTKGAVYFNMDVYNLDAWDSEVMGPFAVDDSVGVVGVRPECGSGEYGDTSSSAYPKAITSPFLGAGASTTDHFQSSLSVLAAYFEEGRQATSTPAPISDDDISSHQALNSGENSTYLPAGALRRSLSPQSGGGGSVFVRSHSFSVRSMSSTSGMARRCGGGNVGSVAANIPEYSCRAYVEKLVASHTTTSAQTTLLQTNICSTDDDYNDNLVVGPLDNVDEGLVDDDTTLPPIVDNIITATSTHVPPMCVIVPPKSPLVSFHPVPMFGGGGREDSSAMSTSANAPKLPTFSEIISRYVTVDTLVHKATSYTEQLANPTSGTGLRKFRRDHDRWQPAPEQLDS